MKKLVLFFFIPISFLQIEIIAQKPDRTNIPKLPAAPELKLPAIQQFELTNGLKVYFMEKHEVPLLQLNVIVKTGSINDPDDKLGIASLSMDMLDEGAAGKSALELADEIDYLGVSISSNSGLHFSSVNLHTPLSKFDDAIKILSNIVLSPDFPKNELDRKKKEVLTTILQWHDQPTIIASVAFNQLLFTKEHPYGKPSAGNESSIKNITSEDLRSFHSKFFKSNNAFIIAVGDLSKDKLKFSLEQNFGKWQKGDVPMIKLKEAEQVKSRTIYLIDKPGAPQSVIYIGRIGVARLTPDYFPLIVMNTILGGSFSSRLNQNLRETHGYTYGAGSAFGFRLLSGPFSTWSSVQTEVTDSALIQFFKELNGISRDIPEDELTRAKNYLALGYLANFQTVNDIAGQISEIIQYSLPGNYFNQYIPSVQGIGLAEVSNAAKKYIVPDQMIVVVVGDKAKIEEGMRKLNLGEIKNLTIKDVLGEMPKIDETF